jgi:hypothetical protein
MPSVPTSKILYVDTPRHERQRVAAQASSSQRSSTFFANAVSGMTDRRAWCLFLALAALQYGLFRQHALREVVWAYPSGYDQLSYLAPSYRLHEQMMQRGVMTAAADYLKTPQPNGVLISLQAAVAFAVLGPGRLTALTLNFFWFVAFQASIAGGLRWLTGRWSAAFLGIGLLMSAQAPFAPCGGLMDYRIDFTALCLMGILLAAVIRSEAFLTPHWSVVAGLVAAVFVLFRFIAAVYLAGMFAIAIVCSVGLLVRRHETAGRRLRGLLLAAAVVGSVTGPVLWKQRHAIAHYYVVGHVTGEEREIRAREYGIYSASDALLYYPRSLVEQHLGATLIWLGGLVLIGSCVVYATCRVRSPSLDGSALARPRLGLAATLVTASVLVCLAVLTANPTKSPVVGGVLVPGLLWSLLLLVVAATRACSGRLSVIVMGGLAVIAVLAGGATQVHSLHRHTAMTHQRKDVESLLSVFDCMGEYSRAKGWDAPKVFTCCVSEWLNPIAAEIMLYERHGQPLRFGSTAGASIFGITESQTKGALERSDFVVFSEPKKQPGFSYPYDESMASLRPLVRDYCKAHLRELGAYSIFNVDVVLYARPQTRIQ